MMHSVRTFQVPGRVVVATHYYATGAPSELYEYLIGRSEELLVIAHPLHKAVALRAERDSGSNFEVEPHR